LLDSRNVITVVREGICLGIQISAAFKAVGAGAMLSLRVVCFYF